MFVCARRYINQEIYIIALLILCGAHMLNLIERIIEENVYMNAFAFVLVHAYICLLACVCVCVYNSN